MIPLDLDEIMFEIVKMFSNYNIDSLCIEVKIYTSTYGVWHMKPWMH